MKCPYCTSEVADEALACPHCTRDLYLLKSLQQQVAELEQKIRELEGRKVAVASDEALEQIPDVVALPPTPLRRAVEVVLLWIAPLALLLFAHELITIIYDAGTLWLHVVSLVIPLPFGLVLMKLRQRHFGVWTVAAFAMAAFAVLGMSAITGFTDATPILPHDLREWREFVEFAASVGFSYLTGMVLGRMLWRRRQRQVAAERAHGLALKLIGLVLKGKANAEKVKVAIRQFDDIRSLLAASTTTAVSIYAGLKSFFG